MISHCPRVATVGEMRSPLSDTITCQAALLTRQAAIVEAVQNAYWRAHANVTEKPAREAAWECFRDMAWDICDRACMEGWEDCDHCH